MPRPIASRRSSLARLLVLGAVLAAMSLGMTAAYAQPLIDHDAGQVLRHRERASQDQVGTAAAGQVLRHRERASQDQTPTGTPATVTVPVRGAEPGGQPGWLIAALGVGAACRGAAGRAGPVGRQAHPRQDPTPPGGVTRRQEVDPTGLHRGAGQRCRWSASQWGRSTGRLPGGGRSGSRCSRPSQAR
jgi:hypothetical protein